MQEIKLADESDRWRYVCPNGHRSWEPTNGHFWCQQCARADADPVFHELHDRREDQRLERDEVQLLTPAGPYERGGTA